MSTIDTHVHCGLDKYRPVGDLLAAMSRAEVDRAVLVQHLGGDNAYLAEAVANAPGTFAAAMWIDTDDRDAPAAFERWLGTGAFRGIRLFADSLVPVPDLWQRVADSGLHVIVGFLHSGLGAHVSRLCEFITRNPRTRIVIGRLGLPVDAHIDATPLRELLELATAPNVTIQLPPVHNREPAPYRATADVVRHLTDRIGPGRIVFGSGFPAHNSAGVLPRPAEHYVRAFELVRSGALGLTPAESRTVLGATPLELWFPGETA